MYYKSNVIKLKLSIKFSGQFSLTSFVDNSYSSIGSATNTVVIGKPVYMRAMVSGNIPSNVKFVVTGCKAMDDATNPTVEYAIIKVNINISKPQYIL